jgi:hypothetical protein
MSNSSYPESVFELDEEKGIGETPGDTLARSLRIVQRESARVLLDSPDGRLDCLPELATKPLALLLVTGGGLVELPLGFGVEDNRFQG